MSEATKKTLTCRGCGKVEEIEEDDGLEEYFGGMDDWLMYGGADFHSKNCLINHMAREIARKDKALRDAITFLVLLAPSGDEGDGGRVALREILIRELQDARVPLTSCLSAQEDAAA